MVVFNKYAREWSAPPVNFLSLKQVSNLANAIISAGGTLVYARTGTSKLNGVSDDGANTHVRPFRDKELILRRTANESDPWHGRVFLMEGLRQYIVSVYLVAPGAQSAPK